AQPRDGEVDRSSADVRAEISPYRTEQFAAAYHHVAMFGEVAQQLELAVRERNRPVSSRRVLVQKVNRHSSQSYPADTRPRAAENGPNARQEFLWIEGLRDVVIRAERQSFQFFCLPRAGGQHDDRDLTALPENRKELEPVAVGQGEIEHDEVWDDRPRLPDAGHAVGSDLDVISFGSEIVLKHEPQRRIVFDDENPVGHRASTRREPDRTPGPDSQLAVNGQRPSVIGHDLGDNRQTEAAAIRR